MIRLTVILSHPSHDQLRWIRHAALRSDALDITLVHGSWPPQSERDQQFGHAGVTDTDLPSGHHSSVFQLQQTGAHDMGAAIDTSRPDAVLLVGGNCLLQARALAECRRRGIPVLYHCEHDWRDRPAGWKGYAWEAGSKLLLSQFSAFLSSGRRASAFLDRFGVPRQRVFFSPYAVDINLFARGVADEARALVRRELALPFDQFCVAFVGDLKSSKRPLDLLEAAASINPPVHLVVMGAGELDSICRTRVRQLGLEVVWAPRKDDADLARLLAGIDCVVVPSERETWGLIVNQVLASGRPCVVSEGVGCAPDLVDGETGARYATGDVSALARAIESVRRRISSGHDYGSACRARAMAYSFERAKLGLEDACRRVTGRSDPRQRASTDPRVLALCGGMVVVFGAERMTFEVLRVARVGGSSVHCILNSWANDRIVPLVEQVGASWSEGGSREALRRRTRDPRAIVRMIWDVTHTSGAMLWEASRFSPTHIFLPDFMAGVRNAPALAVLRLQGVPIVMRASTHPPLTPFYKFLWGRMLPLVVDEFVANSQFSAQRIRDTGVPPNRVRLIPNALAERVSVAARTSDLPDRIRRRRTLLCVGQVAPFKGTHLFIEAVIRLIGEGFDVNGMVIGPIPTWPPSQVEYAQELFDTVKRAGLEDKIEFIGEREDVLDLMASSLLLVAPIIQEETFGNVVLEARSAGLPVVAFATGGVKELIEHERTGYLCHECTVEDLIKGLKFFLEAPARRAAASAACVPLPSQFTREVFARSWCELFGAAGDMNRTAL